MRLSWKDAGVRHQAEGDMMKDASAELEWLRLDLQLDKELEATFPASDALKITRRQPDIFENRQATEDKRRPTSKPRSCKGY
jgi:hypothetical protein